jgi:hypothetical protein
LVAKARKPNETGQKAGFGGKESRKKSRNDSAVRGLFAEAAIRSVPT